MAGAGYKLFNTGDVLTAAQVNTYLQEQVVMVFADATARTTALSGVLAEGMVSYLKDTNATEVYDGSAWVGIGNSGDITGVTAGTGISGGGTSGTVTITNSMATAIDAKGDLVAGTGADAFARLAVGTNGQVLTADSTTATGLKWAAAASSGLNWENWTPTIANFSLGNGTLTARKWKSGTTEAIFIRILFGSTTSVTGTLYITPPGGTSDVQQLFGALSTAQYFDASTGNLYSGKPTIDTAASLKYIWSYVDKTDGTYCINQSVNATVPMTWTTSDQYALFAIYEVA